MPNINLQRTDPNSAARTAVAPKISGGPTNIDPILRGIAEGFNAKTVRQQELAKAISGFGMAVAGAGQKIAGTLAAEAWHVMEVQTQADFQKLRLMLQSDCQAAMQEALKEPSTSAADQCKNFADKLRDKARDRINSFFPTSDNAPKDGMFFRYAKETGLNANDPRIQGMVNDLVQAGSAGITQDWWKANLAHDKFTLDFLNQKTQSDLVDKLCSLEDDDINGMLEAINKADAQLSDNFSQFPHLGNLRLIDNVKDEKKKLLEQAILTAYQKQKEKWADPNYMQGRIVNYFAQAQAEKAKELRAKQEEEQIKNAKEDIKAAQDDITRQFTEGKIKAEDVEKEKQRLNDPNKLASSVVAKQHMQGKIKEEDIEKEKQRLKKIYTRALSELND